MDTSKAKFIEDISKRVSVKTINSTLYTKSKYNEIIQNLESGVKKNYWAQRKFQIATIGQYKQLVLKSVSIHYSINKVNNFIISITIY